MALPAVLVSTRSSAGVESTVRSARLLPVSMRTAERRSRHRFARDAAAHCPLASGIVSGGAEAVRQSAVTRVAVISPAGRHLGARLPESRSADLPPVERTHGD